MRSSVEFSGVWKTYARDFGSVSSPALCGVSFAVEEGETLGLIGANGAGKSTCIRLIMDFIRPDKGVVSIAGCDPRVSSLRNKIGYLPEIASFPASLTLFDMVRFVGASHGLSKKMLFRESEKWMHVLGLWEVRNRPIRTYSKGMQQRASFVLALIHDPDLLILDEPMSGLDPIGRASVGGMIEDLKSQGKTILFCTHILEDVDRLSDRLLVLHHGQKRFEGSPMELSRTFSTDSIIDGFLNAIATECA